MSLLFNRSPGESREVAGAHPKGESHDRGAGRDPEGKWLDQLGNSETNFSILQEWNSWNIFYVFFISLWIQVPS